MVEGQEVAGPQPRMRPRLDDLTQVVSTLRKRGLTPPLVVMFTLFKWAPDNPRGDLLLEGLREELAAVLADKANGLGHVVTALTFIVSVSETSQDRLLPVVRRLGSDVEEAFMATVDVWRAEGQASLVLHLLEAQFGSLPDSVHDRVHAATTSQLTSWGERLLTAATLDELFD